MSFDPRELDDRLRGLQASSSPTKLALEPLAASVSLSRNSDGEPCLVFEVEDQPTPLRQSTMALRVSAHPEAVLVVESVQRNSAIVLVALKDTSFHWHFSVLVAEIAEVVVSRTGAFATSRQVRDHLARWNDVFRRKELTYEKALGLWGELHVLKMLEDADRAIEIWHGPDAAIFDFGANDVAIEVKTSERRRRHWFDLRQVAEGNKPRVLIASVVTEKDPASGETLGDKVNLVRSMLSSPLLFDQKLARMGFEPSTLTSLKVRATNVVFLAAADIPRPRNFDDGVEEVKFLVDATDVPPISAAECAVLVERLLDVSR